LNLSEDAQHLLTTEQFEKLTNFIEAAAFNAFNQALQGNREQRASAERHYETHKDAARRALVGD
jgi:hypothetical protein